MAGSLVSTRVWARSALPLAALAVLTAAASPLARFDLNSASTPTAALPLSADSSATEAGARWCGRLSAGPGPIVSPLTGEHAVIVALTNSSSRRCEISGYPLDPRLSDDARALRFRFVREHSQYLTSRPPRLVVLAPGGRAYVEFAKYRCDRGVVANPTALEFAPPSGGRLVTLPLRRPGVSSLSYCKGGANDPGNTVSFSPVEPAAFAAAP